MLSVRVDEPEAQKAALGWVTSSMLSVRGDEPSFTDYMSSRYAPCMCG